MMGIKNFNRYLLGDTKESMMRLLSFMMVFSACIGVFATIGYDKENNIWYEWDESRHYKNGILKEKDLKRQKRIIDLLNCEFIRIKA